MRWVWVCAAVLGVGAWGARAGAQEEPGAAAVEVSREEAWREDIGFLAGELPKRHKNLYFKVTKEEFEREARLLSERVGALKDHEIVVGMMRLCALVGDAHTGVGAGGTKYALR